MPFEYKLKTLTELVPVLKSPALLLEVDCLENLDETIDHLFAQLKETGDERLLEELCPYFGTIWPSARALAAEIGALGTTQAKRGRWLEVGCGLALPSLVLAKLGADVTATDFHPEVPRFLERNVARNGISRLPYKHFDWQKEPEELGKFDWVIGSDILYEKQHPADVARALAKLVQPEGSVIVADPARPYLQIFSDAMEREGFRTKSSVRVNPADRREIFLLTFSH